MDASATFSQSIARLTDTLLAALVEDLIFPADIYAFA